MKIFSRNEKRAMIYIILNMVRDFTLVAPEKKRTFALWRRNLGRKWRDSDTCSTSSILSEDIPELRSSWSQERSRSRRKEGKLAYTRSIYVILSAALDEGRRAHIHTQRHLSISLAVSLSRSLSLVALALSRDAKELPKKWGIFGARFELRVA